MEIDRRNFIKTTTLAGIGIGLSTGVYSMSPNKSAEGGRIGIIGLDTSHVIAFTKAFNNNKPEFAGFKVVAAYPTKGSVDMPSSIDRLEGFTEEIRGMGVEIVNSIQALLKKVDVVLLESVDGRRHLAEAIPVLKAGKSLFIDKPISHSLASAMAIFEASEKYNVPVFSSSSTRFAPAAVEIAKGKESVGRVLSVNTYGPAKKAEGHPDMFYYGIHAIESIFTLMGVGCKEVVRLKTPIADVVAGTWEDGRMGVFNATPDGGKAVFGGTVHGEKGVEEGVKILAGYDPLLVEITNFFRTGIVPVSKEETLELVAFMEAADESKAANGMPISIESVMQRAKLKAKEIKF